MSKADLNNIKDYFSIKQTARQGSKAASCCFVRNEQKITLQYSRYVDAKFSFKCECESYNLTIIKEFYSEICL